MAPIDYSLTQLVADWEQGGGAALRITRVYQTSQHHLLKPWSLIYARLYEISVEMAEEPLFLRLFSTWEVNLASKWHSQIEILRRYVKRGF
jgi:hypothetical protein